MHRANAPVESPPTPREAWLTKTLLTALSVVTLILIVTFAGFMTFSGGYVIVTAFSTKTFLYACFIAVVVGGVVLALLAPILVALVKSYELPPGIDVTGRNGANLWKATRDVCTAAGLTPPDRILLTPDLNAFAANAPTRGILRRHERVLGLGYPLLATLTVEQAGAVIAHEMRHLDHRQTRGDSLHHFVAEVMGSFDEMREGWFARAIGFPVSIYMNLANRLGARMSRHHEFEADALAAELFGERTAVEALVALATYGEETMRSVMRTLATAWQKGDPVPQSILGAIDATLHTEAMQARMRKVLEVAIAEKTHKFSSHPSLSDRAAALGQRIAMPAMRRGDNAAHALLWQDHDDLRDAVDKLLAEMLGAGFEERAKEVAAVEALVLAQLPGALNGTKSREQAEVVSLLMERTLYSEHTREQHLALLARFPDIPSSICELAAEKLRAENVEGAEEMLAVFERHPMMSGEAKEFLDWAMSMRHWEVDDQWLREWATDPRTRKRFEAANREYTRLDQINARRHKAVPDRLEPHGLEKWHEDLLLREICDLLPDVSKIWLAREPADAEKPYANFRLMVETRTLLMEAPRGVSGLCCLPAPLLAYYKNNWDVFTGVARVLANAPGALIYRASDQNTGKPEPIRQAA